MPVLGASIMVFVAVLPFGYGEWSRATTAHRLTRVSADWHQLWREIAAYGVDRCGVYSPPDTAGRREVDPYAQLTFENSIEFLKKRNGAAGTIGAWDPLTTPVAYINAIPTDPFRPGKQYDYTCWNIHDEVPSIAILHSPGPDEKDDLPLAQLRGEYGAYLATRRGAGCCACAEDRGVLMCMTRPFTYDPTNGAASAGDLFSFYDFCTRGGFGHPDVNWDAAPAPDLPLAARSGVDPQWKPGMPLDEPRSAAEKIAWGWWRPVQYYFQSIAEKNGLLAGEDSTTSDGWYLHMKLRLEPLAPVQKYLETEVRFELNPGPLDSDQLQTLNRQIAENPKWWGALGTTECVVLKGANDGKMAWQAKEWYVFLPIFCKSQLLLAARDLATSQPDMARERIEAVAELLGKEYPKTQIEKIHMDLRPLCSELGRKLPIPDSAREAHQ